MTYRDDIGQAHQRIAHLEEELAGERAKHEAPRARARRGPLLVALLAVVIAGGAAGAWLFTREPPRPLLIAPVDALVREPARYEGKRMRTQGELVAGTTVKSGDPCEMSFMLERAGLRMPVRLRGCVVPDGFREASAGLSILVEGELSHDGAFDATQVLVRFRYDF